MPINDVCIIDTNVPLTANLATSQDETEIDLECIEACIETINNVKAEKIRIALDDENEIFSEYMNKLSLSGQPGVGDAFLKWIYDNQWNSKYCDRIPITKEGDSYHEFPMSEALQNFDRSDRKFVTVASVHPKKPPIMQATDSKWWGWSDALDEVGISVIFLCESYISSKYAEKMEK